MFPVLLSFVLPMSTEPDCESSAAKGGRLQFEAARFDDRISLSSAQIRASIVYHMED